jgi:hypothetical protein
MTKAQRIAVLEAQLAASGISVEPLPDLAATAPTGWLTPANVAVIKAPAVKAAVTVYVPKPLTVGLVGIYPKPGGEQFEPYTMLSLENQAHGKAHRSIRLRQRYLDEILAFVAKHGRILPKPPKQ